MITPNSKAKAKAGADHHAYVPNEGMGRKKAKILLQHDMFKEIFEARNQQLEIGKRDGYLMDAFGNQIDIIDKERTVESSMAYVAQSWELKLMLAAFGVIKEEEQVYIVSFLHDGITIRFTHADSKPSQLKRIIQAVDNESSKMNIQTRLEVEQLSIP